MRCAGFMDLRERWSQRANGRPALIRIGSDAIFRMPSRQALPVSIPVMPLDGRVAPTGFQTPCRGPALRPTGWGVAVSAKLLVRCGSPPMLAPCSASMRRRPRPSVGCSMNAANCPPRSSSAGTSPGSRIMPPPGVASGRSRVGSRCLPCPGSEPEHVGSNHRRPDRLRHSCRCGATYPLVGWIVMRDQPDYPDETTRAW